MSYFHVPVLLKEVIETIDPKPGENLIDGTVGGAGHAEAILEKTAPDGRFLGIDLDEEALKESKRRLEKYASRVTFARGNFIDYPFFRKEYNFSPVNIFFLDLGISSQQLNNETMGISFLKNAPLDMRIGGYDPESDDRKSAESIVNSWSENSLKSMIKEYGEERYASKIAREIIKARENDRIMNTEQLVQIISRAVPEVYKRQRIHFATRTFQAFRIAVNRELENLENILPRMLDDVEIGGRIAIISFHSLEDRIVKNFFQKESKDCICDPEVPVCVCNHKKRLQPLTKKPIMATEEEIAKNPRSRSAKLRVAVKIR